MATTTPKLISDKNEMRNWSRSMRAQGKLIGFVPTMGFLHAGHLSLVSQARSLCDVVAVSIYVNPGQFAPSEDLSTYPSDFQGDLCKLAALPGGVDVVFHPRNLYDYGNNSGDVAGQGGGAAASCVDGDGSGHETWVRAEKLEVGLCGKSRPIFFRGVATIVTKLFNIVEPDVAVFGKKDYQQLRVSQRMVRDLDFSIKVIGAEISRESDGLAMSSRNVHLSPEEREKALSINKSLLKAKSTAEDGEVHCEKLRNLVIQCISEAGGRVDYAEIVDQNNLEKVEKLKGPVVFCVAAWFGKVRLIDNMEINLSIAKLCQGQRLPQVEGERLTNLLQSMRREIRSARDSDGTSLPEKIWLKQQFSIGVNDVTRVLERMKPCTELESSAQLVPLRSNNNKTPSVKLQASRPRRWR